MSKRGHWMWADQVGVGRQLSAGQEAFYTCGAFDSDYLHPLHFIVSVFLNRVQLRWVGQ